MRNKVKTAIGNTVQDMLNSGFKCSFTTKELKNLGIDIPSVALKSAQIKAIRQKKNCSQAVFAKLLNVSPSAVRQWEQGKRTPTGSTMVLLELLEKSPDILDYRIDAPTS